jgi:hypothetical protein
VAFVAGMAITVAEVDDKRAVPFQLYISAPWEVRAMLWPAHIVPPVAVTFGKGFTVTVALAFLKHPLVSAPMTV